MSRDNDKSVVTQSSNLSSLRVNLSLSGHMAEQVQGIAQEHNMSINDLMRLFIELGIVADAVSRKPDADLIVSEEGKQKRIVMYPDDSDDIYLGRGH